MGTELQNLRRERRQSSGSPSPSERNSPAAPADAWDALLDLCSRRHGEDSQLYGVCKGFRAYGAVVQGGRILPGTYDADEWDHDRAVWLLPHRNEIAALLRDVVA